jgi:peptidoglycan/xylan/chitin deacetylase (PgdA/CDA1 family)
VRERRARRGRWLALAALALTSTLGAGPGATQGTPAVDDGAVVVMYHRFGEADFPATNIRIDQFEAHLAELASPRYSVLPLSEIVAAFADARPLPPRSVAITIDDAFASVYAEAWPRLRQAGLPFTLFVSTDALDRGLPGYMSWDQLREMVAAGGVSVGHHGAAHAHMATLEAAAARADLARASARFTAELGGVPELFAYPYGEYGRALRDMVAATGVRAAFGQHSGAAARSDDRFALPRFPLNERYGELDRFRLAIESLPLPVQDLTPADPLIGPDNNPPAYGFTVLPGVAGLDALACYAGGRAVAVERLGETRFEVRLGEPLPAGRARVNCTVPGPEGRWRWRGRQFYLRP